jgi:hypothetical protein
MILSIHTTAATQAANGWPKFWPPVQLPPPTPLTAAATLLWAPKTPRGETQAIDAPANASLYSTQLSPGEQSGSGNFQMHYIDQRIALMRYDASHAQASAPVSGPVSASGNAAA